MIGERIFYQHYQSLCARNIESGKSVQPFGRKSGCSDGRCRRTDVPVRDKVLDTLLELKSKVFNELKYGTRYGKEIYDQ